MAATNPDSIRTDKSIFKKDNSLILNIEAPKMIGIDSIKEYFAANSRSKFLDNPAITVKPDLDIPGKIARA